MKSHALVTSLVLMLAAPVWAQSSTDDMRQQRDAANQRAAAADAKAEELLRKIESEDWASLDPAVAKAKLELYKQELAQLRTQATEERTRAGNMTGTMQQVARQTEQAATQTNGTGTNRTGTNGTNQQPGFMSKVGDKLLEVAGGVAGQLLQRIISGGATNEDREMFSQLVAQRDAALAEANNIQDGSNPYGNPIYDANGNIIGWDRDGDGAQDLADSDGNGKPDAWTGGTNSDAYDEFGGLEAQPTPIYRDGQLVGYDTNGDGIVDVSAEPQTNITNSGGGGASGGNTIGGSIGGGSSAGDKDKKEDDKDKKKDDKDKKDEDKDKKDGDKKDDDKDKKDDDKKDDLAAAEGERRVQTGHAQPLNLQSVRGRMIVVPKPDPTRAGVFGNQRGGQYGATNTPYGSTGATGGQYGNPNTPTTPQAGQGGQQGGEWWNSDPAPTADPWNDKDNGDVPSEWGQFNEGAWGDGQGGAQAQPQGGNNTWGAPQTPATPDANGNAWGTQPPQGGQGGQWGQNPQGGYPQGGNPYGQPPAGTYGYGYQQPAQNLAQLAEQLSSIDGVIEGWRKVERQRSGFGTPEDAYGSGYRGNRRGGTATGGAPARNAYGQEIDELAQYRTPDGLLDMNKVEVWVIADDPHSGRASWKEPQPGEMPIMPIRFKVTITPEALETFEAIQGGYVVVKGVVAPMSLPPQMMQQVRGQVLTLTIHQWLGTTKTPPLSRSNPAYGNGNRRGGAARSQYDDF